MNIEKQNIAIAVACGWTEIEPCTCRDGVSRGYEPSPGAHKKHVPNYLISLDAMHEAENVLTEDKADTNGKDQRCQFITHLGEIIGCWKSGRTHNSLFHQAHATAEQRAEAFLRTIGKWEEEQVSQ